MMRPAVDYPLTADPPNTRPMAALCVALCVALTLLGGGCVGLQQYHTEAPAETASPEQLECLVGDEDVPKDGWKCGDAYLENRPEYLLGFVEFDDLGWSWNTQQQAKLLSAIEAETKARDALIVVFAHGWKHNASTCDNNVTCFRETLDQLHKTEEAVAAAKGKTPRRIIGVYVGWRGDSAKGKLLRQTTFFGRKSTAHKVGSGSVTELLVRLKEVRAKAYRMREASDTRLVVVGHSFGGALIYSATSQLIVERLAVSAAREDTVEGFADLVVLVNPAFEAALYQPLHQAVLDRAKKTHSDGVVGFEEGQKPVFIIVTSQGDSATGKAFPAGRFVAANFLDDYRTDAERPVQKKANQKAVGHFLPYRTHVLESTPNTPPILTADKKLDKRCICPYRLSETPQMDPSKASANVTELSAAYYKGTTRLEFPTSTLVWDTEKSPDDQTPYNSPVMVISTQPTIIAKHSDIYQPAFVDFLRYLIMLSGDYGAQQPSS